MTPLLLVVAALAVYRLSYLIAQEEGPFGVMAWLRGKVDPEQSSWIGRGVRCVACVSFWVAGAAAVLLGASALEWLGMAGAVLIVHKLVNGR